MTKVAIIVIPKALFRGTAMMTDDEALITIANHHSSSTWATTASYDGCGLTSCTSRSRRCTSFAVGTCTPRSRSPERSPGSRYCKQSSAILAGEQSIPTRCSRRNSIVARSPRRGIASKPPEFYHYRELRDGRLRSAARRRPSPLQIGICRVDAHAVDEITFVVAERKRYSPVASTELSVPSTFGDLWKIDLFCCASTLIGNKITSCGLQLSRKSSK